METLTADQFKKQYGVIAYSQFDLGKKKQEQEASLFDQIKSTIGQTAQQNNQILDQPRNGVLDNVAGGAELAANTANGVAGVAGNVLSKIPVVGPAIKAVGGAIKSGFNATTDAISNTPLFKGAAEGLNAQYGSQQSPLEKGLSVASSGGQIAGDILAADQGAGIAQKGVNVAKAVPGAVADTATGIVEALPKPTKAGLGQAMTSASESVPTSVSETLGTKQSWIDHNLTVALDLTPGDLSTISKSTGNDVGRWMADNDLIGSNKAGTQSLIKSFFTQNYNAVRSEIGKVGTVYKPYQIPSYTDSLNAIKSSISGVPGLGKEAARIDNLLNLGKDITLKDVQTVKEMLDEHFKLYNALGDVAENNAKKGIANFRTDLKNFIEQQVKENTKTTENPNGIDIGQMNNNVSTAKSLGDAIETRSPKGLTRSQFTQRDLMMGLGLTYFASPLVGIAAVFIKKVMTSPSVRLRIARYLDGLNDAQRLQISKDLETGKVPTEVLKAAGE